MGSICGGGGNNNQTTTNSSSPPPQLLADYQAGINRATAVANTPYTPYPGEQVAPLSNQTVAGLSNMDKYAYAAQPYLDQAGNMVQQGSGMQTQAGQFQQQGAGMQNQAGQYQQQGAGMQAQAGAMQNQGYNTVGQGAGMIPQAGNMTLGAASPVTMDQYSGDALTKYMNPYTKSVVDATQAEFNNQNAQQAQFLNSQNIGAGAFGGDRAGLSQSILANQQNLAQAPVIAGLNQANFNQATAEFNNQQQTGLGTQEFNRQQLGQMGNQYGNLGTALSGMGAQMGNLGQQYGNTGNNLVSAGTAYGNTGNNLVSAGTAYGNTGNNLMNAGTAYGNVGTAKQAAGTQGAANQINYGMVPQSEQQAIDTAGQNTWNTGQAYPFQTTSFLNNTIQGLGSQSGGTGSTTTPGPSGISQLLGAATGVAGIGTNIAQGAGALGFLPFASDVRAKENIIPVGKTFDGQTIHKYNFKGDPRSQIGLLAQEVEQSHPHAVGQGLGGLKTVDYDAATKGAERGRFAGGGGLGDVSPGSLYDIGLSKPPSPQGALAMMGVPGADAGTGSIGKSDLTQTPGGTIFGHGQSQVSIPGGGPSATDPMDAGPYRHASTPFASRQASPMFSPTPRQAHGGRIGEGLGRVGREIGGPTGLGSNIQMEGIPNLGFIDYATPVAIAQGTGVPEPYSGLANIEFSAASAGSNVGAGNPAGGQQVGTESLTPSLRNLSGAAPGTVFKDIDYQNPLNNFQTAGAERSLGPHWFTTGANGENVYGGEGTAPAGTAGAINQGPLLARPGGNLPTDTPKTENPPPVVAPAAAAPAAAAPPPAANPGAGAAPGNGSEAYLRANENGALFPWQMEGGGGRGPWGGPGGSGGGGGHWTGGRAGFQEGGGLGDVSYYTPQTGNARGATYHPPLPPSPLPPVRPPIIHHVAPRRRHGAPPVRAQAPPMPPPRPADPPATAPPMPLPSLDFPPTPERQFTAPRSVVDPMAGTDMGTTPPDEGSGIFHSLLPAQRGPRGYTNPYPSDPDPDRAAGLDNLRDQLSDRRRGGRIGRLAGGQIGFMANTPLYSSPAQSMNYQYSGPTNFGVTQYSGGPGLGGQAGLYGYNPAIAPPQGPAPTPAYTNSISPDRWNAIAALKRAQQNPTTIASNSPFPVGLAGLQQLRSSQQSTDGGGGNIPIGGGEGNVLEQPTGPGSGYAPHSFGPYDPQGTAYDMMYNNRINPALARSNLNRYANQINQSGLFGNPNAGQAMGSVAGAESAGNPFVRNSIGAFGMNQWLNQPGDQRGSNASYLMGGNYSPESQASVAMSEILGKYPGVYGALNNPNSTLKQMQGAVINQFEGLQNYPSQANQDMAGAARYAGQLGTVATGQHRASGGKIAAGATDDPDLPHRMRDVVGSAYADSPYIKLPDVPDWRQSQDLHDEGRPGFNSGGVMGQWPLAGATNYTPQGTGVTGFDSQGAGMGAGSVAKSAGGGFGDLFGNNSKRESFALQGGVSEGLSGLGMNPAATVQPIPYNILAGYMPLSVGKGPPQPTDPKAEKGQAAADDAAKAAGGISSKIGDAFKSLGWGHPTLGAGQTGQGLADQYASAPDEDITGLSIAGMGFGGIVRPGRWTGGSGANASANAGNSSAAGAGTDAATAGGYGASVAQGISNASPGVSFGTNAAANNGAVSVSFGGQGDSNGAAGGTGSGGGTASGGSSSGNSNTDALRAAVRNAALNFGGDPGVASLGVPAGVGGQGAAPVGAVTRGGLGPPGYSSSQVATINALMAQMAQHGVATTPANVQAFLANLGPGYGGGSPSAQGPGTTGFNTKSTGAEGVATLGHPGGDPGAAGSSAVGSPSGATTVANPGGATTAPHHGAVTANDVAQTQTPAPVSMFSTPAAPGGLGGLSAPGSGGSRPDQRNGQAMGRYAYRGGRTKFGLGGIARPGFLEGGPPDPPQPAEEPEVEAPPTAVAAPPEALAPAPAGEGLGGVDSDFQRNITAHESGGRNLVSPAGARGPGQIMPGTFKQYALPGENIDNPEDNTRVQGRILADYAKRWPGDRERQAVAYFSGPGNVAPAGSPNPWVRDAHDVNESTSKYVANLGLGHKGGVMAFAGADGVGAHPDQNQQQTRMSAVMEDAARPPDRRLIPEGVGDALMAAGFAMMAGTSPNAGVNIGQGALAGMKYYQGQRQLDREWQKNEAQIEDWHSQARFRDASTNLSIQNLDIERYKAQLDGYRVQLAGWDGEGEMPPPPKPPASIAMPSTSAKAPVASPSKTASAAPTASPAVAPTVAAPTALPTPPAEIAPGAPVLAGNKPIPVTPGPLVKPDKNAPVPAPPTAVTPATAPVATATAPEAPAGQTPPTATVPDISQDPDYQKGRTLIEKGNRLEAIAPGTGKGLISKGETFLDQANKRYEVAKTNWEKTNQGTIDAQKPVLQEYLTNRQKFESNYDATRSEISELANIYTHFQAGRSTEAQAELASWANAFGIKLPQAAGFDAGMKSAIQQAFAAVANSGLQKAPRAGLREATMMVASPSRDPAALRKVLSDQLATLDYNHDLYQNVPGHNLSVGDDIEGFTSKHKYEEYLAKARKDMPMFKGITPETLKTATGEDLRETVLSRLPPGVRWSPSQGKFFDPSGKSYDQLGNPD